MVHPDNTEMNIKTKAARYRFGDPDNSYVCLASPASNKKHWLSDYTLREFKVQFSFPSGPSDMQMTGFSSLNLRIYKES